jgi:hypothetical protein
MPEANGMILSKEEENDAEVRREDQDAINEFGRLNARLDEVKRQKESMKVRIIALLYMIFARYIKYLLNYISDIKHNNVCWNQLYSENNGENR